MRELIQLIDEMLNAGVLKNYAIFGALAQMRYTEAVVTMDADILVGVGDEGLAVLLTFSKLSVHSGDLLL